MRFTLTYAVATLAITIHKINAQDVSQLLSSQYYSYGGKGGDNDDQPKPPKLAGKAEKTSAPTISPIDDESSAASYFGTLLISLHLRCVCCVCVL